MGATGFSDGVLQPLVKPDFLSTGVVHPSGLQTCVYGEQSERFEVRRITDRDRRRKKLLEIKQAVLGGRRPRCEHHGNGVSVPGISVCRH